jgi:hypothetical protein
MAPVAPRLVAAPPVTPLRYGLLDAAVVVDNPDGHIGLGIEWEPEGCDLVFRTLGACIEAASGVDKTINDGIPLVQADAFAVYNLVRCRPVGVDAAALKERAADGLRLGEGRGVEQAFEEAYFADAVDLTPSGSPVDMVDGLAILEGYAASVYGGNPTIHIPRGIGTALFSRLAILRGSRTLETGQGSLVASGGGYTGEVGPSAVDADAAWIFASGTVLAQRNPVQWNPAMAAVMASSEGEVTNDIYVLAERTYAVGYECFLVGVQVLTSNCCGAGGVDGGSP